MRRGARLSTELAWSAGFFDGEGSSCIQGKPGTRTVCLKVSQVEPAPLERFHLATREGNFNGPYEQRADRGQPYYHWNCAGRKARRVMQKLWPYLSEPKRHQYIVALCKAQRMTLNGE